MLKKAGVAILGLGVVGGGTYEILTKNREYFKKTQGVDVTVECVLEKNRDRAIALGVEESKIASSIEEVVSNPDVDIVVEVIGGTGVAKTFVMTALMSGKTLAQSVEIAVDFTVSSINRTANGLSNHCYGIDFEHGIADFIKSLEN